jgi:hypothetical protein
VIAASYMREGDLEPSYISGGDVIQKMFWIMCDCHEFVWYAHNAQYEWRYLISHLEHLKDDLDIFCRTSSDIFMLKLRLPEHEVDGIIPTLVMRDSYAVFDFSLEKFGAVFCPEIPKGSIDFEGGVIFDPKNQDHIDYSKRDSELLLKSLIRYDDLLYENFDIHLRLTIAGTAMAAWQRTLKKESADDYAEKYFNDKENETFVRSGYFGGLVFLTSTRPHDDATTHDINSSYPYQMVNHDMPIGRACRTKLWDSRRLGLYDVSVRAPKSLVVPILPLRDKKGIVWPAGSFRTTVTSEEIKFAVAQGYVIEKIHDGLVWHETGRPFEVFISRCKYLRVHYKDTALEFVAKKLQNSLYGKFGSRRTRRKFYSSIPEPEENQSEEEAGVGFEPWGKFFIREERSDDMQCLPQWAVFITAYARLHLLRAAYEAGPENCLYGDTDSLTLKAGVTLPPEICGTEYGQWKPDKNWQSFRARGPKVYAGVQVPRVPYAAKVTGAAKGIPRKQWEASGALTSIYNGENKVVNYRTLEKFVMALKTGYIGEHEATRAISVLSNSRNWQEFANGEVRPREYGGSQADCAGEQRLRSSGMSA